MQVFPKAKSHVNPFFDATATVKKIPAIKEGAAVLALAHSDLIFWGVKFGEMCNANVAKSLFRYAIICTLPEKSGKAQRGFVFTKSHSNKKQP